LIAFFYQKINQQNNSYSSQKIKLNLFKSKKRKTYKNKVILINTKPNKQKNQILFIMIYHIPLPNQFSLELMLWAQLLVGYYQQKVYYEFCQNTLELANLFLDK